MIEQKRTKYTLIAILMAMLFNYPLLDIANKNKYLGNIPILYVYMSVVWLLAIILLYITSVSNKKPKRRP